MEKEKPALKDVSIPLHLRKHKIMHLYGVAILEHIEEFMQDHTPELLQFKDGRFDYCRDMFLDIRNDSEYGLDPVDVDFGFAICCLYLVRRNLKMPKNESLRAFVVGCVLLAEILFAERSNIQYFHFCQMSAATVKHTVEWCNFVLNIIQEWKEGKKEWFDKDIF